MLYVLYLSMLSMNNNNVKKIKIGEIILKKKKNNEFYSPLNEKKNVLIHFQFTLFNKQKDFFFFYYANVIIVSRNEYLSKKL